MVYIYRGALDEERKTTSHLHEALTYEQATSSQYVDELEAERQRGVRAKDRNAQIIQVHTVSHSRVKPNIKLLQ